MANEKNLEKGKATQFTSGEVAARNGSKGGKKKAERKKMKDTMQMILALNIPTIDVNSKF